MLRKDNTGWLSLVSISLIVKRAHSYGKVKYNELRANKRIITIILHAMLNLSYCTLRINFFLKRAAISTYHKNQ